MPLIYSSLSLTAERATGSAGNSEECLNLVDHVYGNIPVQISKEGQPRDGAREAKSFREPRIALE